MMAAVFGKVGEFEAAKEEMSRGKDTFEANGIKDEGKKRSIFFTVVGPTVFKLIHTLVSPAKPGDTSYGDLVKLLTEHYRSTHGISQEVKGIPLCAADAGTG